MVTNYTPDSCKYSIGKLTKSVYLISDEAIKDIRIDNGDAWIESVSQTPIMLDCYSVSLQDEESLDERYKFIHTLEFSMNGYANSEDFQGRYYAIVKDYDDTYWLVNPLFPCKVTYKYTLGYQQNHTDFTLSTASNHPVLRLKNMVDAAAYECHEYFLDGIDALWLNEKKYSVHTGNSIKYTNDGFKEIDYNKGSAVFTESFDGTNTSHSIEFDILFSYYKSSWHYNLLEFNDNLYAAIIKTTKSKYALCGFSFGLQPSFKVSADDTIQATDKIHITLEDAHDVGDTIEMYDDIAKARISTATYEYTSEYDGYECVEDGVAKYLLQKEVDAFGNETGNYKVLSGYESHFPNLNIVGTFSDIVLFSSSECVGYGSCTLTTSLSDLTFNEPGSKTLYLMCDSDWSIASSAEHITVSPSTGEAKTAYDIVITNTKEPSESAETSTLTLSYCFNRANVYTVKVREYDGCLTKGYIYSIDAPATTVNIPSKCCIEKVTETTSIGVIINLYSNYFIVYVPENNTGLERVIRLLVEYCDGTSQTVEIHQGNVFTEWREEGEHFCIYNNEYKRERLYSGNTSSSLVATDETRDVFVEAGSEMCDGVLYRWVPTGEEGCDGCNTGSYMYVSFWHVDNSNPSRSGSTWIPIGWCSDCGTISPCDTGGQSVACEDYGSHHRKYLCLSDDLVVYDFHHDQSGAAEFPGLINRTEDGCVTQYNCCYVGDEYGLQNDFIPPEGLGAFSMQLYQDSDNVEITLPNGVVSVPMQTFTGCRYLKTVVFGHNVRYISSQAFYQGVYSSAVLENIIIYATTPPEIVGHTTFDSVSRNVKIFVPAEAVGNYKLASGWSNYNNIYAIE